MAISVLKSSGLPSRLLEDGDLERIIGGTLAQAVMIYEMTSNCERGIWKTATGELISIRDMGTDHIRNTISLIKRRVCTAVPEIESYTRSYLKQFNEELVKRSRKLNGKKGRL